MNATTGTEKIDSTEEQSNLAAVSDVEAGIRDFVRNDVANLRRPTSGPPGSIDPVTEQSPEVSVNNVVDPTRRRRFNSGHRKPDFRTRKSPRSAPY